MNLSLEGKTALVTGASSQGIGRAIAKGLAAEGVQLCVAARRRELLEQLAEEIVAAGGRRPVVVPVDLANVEGPSHLVEEALKQLGSVDILGNSAGFGTAGLALDTPE
ncbi:MAG: Fatty acyl-CoA reductase [Nitrospira sp.]|nr:Fatty acyl-CoA reductase [Nitrospira sp.]